jgi:cell division protein FtsQ
VSAVSSRPVFLDPRGRRARPADLASRAALMANQHRRARKARRPRRTLRALGRALAVVSITAALAVAAMVATDWVRRTPLLAIHTIDVEGVRRLDAASVLEVAGIDRGANLLALDVAAVERRLANLPGVRRAYLVRQLPGRVTVVVEEREPYALVNAEGLRWVDSEGYLVGADARPGAPGLPILTGVEAPADPAAPASERLRSGLALLHVLQRSAGRLVSRISEIDLSGAQGPVLYLMDGIEVRVGTEGWADRLARLDGVLADLDGKGERIASVDMRFRDLVVLMPRSTQASAPAAARAPRPAVPRRAAALSSNSVAPAAAGLERR